MRWLGRLLHRDRGADARPVDDMRRRIPSSSSDQHNYVSLSATLLDRQPQMKAMMTRLRQQVAATGDRKLLVFARGGREDCLPFLFTRLTAVEWQADFPGLAVHRVSEIEVNWRGRAPAIAADILDAFLDDLRSAGLVDGLSGWQSLQRPAIAQLLITLDDWQVSAATQPAVAELVRRFADLTLASGLFFLLICLEGQPHRDLGNGCAMGDFALELAAQHGDPSWMLVLDPAPVIDRSHVGPWVAKMMRLLGDNRPGLRHDLTLLESRINNGVPLATLEPEVRDHVKKIAQEWRILA